MAQRWLRQNNAWESDGVGWSTQGMRKSSVLVPEAGIEPAWAFWARGILSPLRLPISPLRQQEPQWRDSSIGV